MTPIETPSKDKNGLTRHNYICLCKKLNKRFQSDTSILNTLFGFPMHTYLVYITVNILSISLLIWLVNATAIVNNQNQSYFAKCISNVDCDNTRGLKCGVENGNCNCPARNMIGRCDCNPGNYWNGTQCSIKISYNSTGCASDYQCENSKGLKCSNSMCNCVIPKYWRNSTQMCDYSYYGCFNETSTAYTFISQNDVSRMPYFVETCISTCNKKTSKYAATATTSTSAYCFCMGSFIPYPVTHCNVICPGSNSNGYLCGYSTIYTKAVYLAS
jgi:hypothetical protein